MDNFSPLVSGPVESVQFQTMAPAAGNLTEVKGEQAAKDFESIFILKLLEEMTKTVAQWGLEKESGSEQIQGLFSLCLSQHIADNGGLGLYREIYESVADSQNSQIPLTEENL